MTEQPDAPEEKKEHPFVVNEEDVEKDHKAALEMHREMQELHGYPPKEIPVETPNLREVGPEETPEDDTFSKKSL